MKDNLSEMLTVYNPKESENNWYNFWVKKGYFHPKDNKDKGNQYSIVIPPPNVTGSLHIGHALNNTLQDILVRWKRMQGFSVLWLPGTDHAGIATQNVVEREIAKNGQTKEDLGREKFVEKVWQWKEKYGSNIVEQLKKLGFSCDWSRLRFTFDDGLSMAVRKVFVQLYNEGLIYRENYVVNWCPRCQTAIADIEVESREENAKLYYINYPIEDSEDLITVATTRPETMLGDTAIAVNPNDKRFKKYVGKSAILPIVGRKLLIVEDEYVDPEFGTGAVKITPAHDLNDFELGKRHQLEEINILNNDGTMNKNAGKYQGLTVLACRNKLLKELKKQKYLQKIEDYTHAIGHCYRCDTVIEPYLSKQWFVKIKDLADPAIKAVEEGKVKFTPERWTKVYFEWMRNIKDWCISRQLWWGHRIPVWYCQDCGALNVSEKDPEKCEKCKSRNLKQDPDVLDTWFSSGLWPFSTLGWPEKTDDLKRFYPTSALVTGFDIIFFWVARMIMLGLKFGEDVPFKHVFINPLIKDAEGKKMSKSKGNVIDPLTIVDKFGADALRITLASMTIHGNYICLSEERIKGFRNFTNKIWNVSRFTLNNLKDFDLNKIDKKKLNMTLADRWILSRLNKTIKSTSDYLESYNYGEAVKTIYEFVWNEFCDWYVEFIKPRLYKEQDKIDKETAQYVLWYTLENILRLLHPFTPFITEEIWQKLPHEGESIMIAPWPKVDKKSIDDETEKNTIKIMDIVKTIRNIKSDMNIPYSREVEIFLNIGNDKKLKLINDNLFYIESLIKTKSIHIGKQTKKPEFSATGVLEGIEIFIPLKGIINIDEEIERLDKRLKKTIIELNIVSKKLSNNDFLAKAPENIIEKEKNKVVELNGIKDRLQNNLQNLR